MEYAVELHRSEQEALDRLIPRGRGPRDLTARLAAAGRETMRRREQNSRDGGAVFAALHRFGYSWREIEEMTGVPFNTARRWAVPPEQADVGVVDEAEIDQEDT